MKRRNLLYIILVFIINSVSVAIARDYRVLEIDSIEYYSAKCGFEKQNLFIDSETGYSPEAKEFLYKIVTSDDSARNIYLEEIISDGWFSHDFSCVNFDNSIILLLQFNTPLESFLYAAAVHYNTPISISNTKINSAPIVISKDGYIAGFRENNDEFFADLKIYKMNVDVRGTLDITETFSYFNHNDPWHISNTVTFPVFWGNDSLYIAGVRLGQSDENVYLECPCYFKVTQE